MRDTPNTLNSGWRERRAQALYMDLGVWVWVCGDDQIGTKKEANAAPNHGSMISRIYISGGETRFLWIDLPAASFL